MNEATRQFVLQHSSDDVRLLALKGCRNAEVDLPMALQQIQGRQAARQKLPLWAETNGILFPPHLALEQCSSQYTAHYKAHIVDSITDKAQRRLLVDLTGGYGVDFAMMAPLFQKAVYVERQEELCTLARHNFNLLPALAGKATVVQADAVDFLNRMENHASMVFLDPARRDNNGQRTFGMADCTPNVLTIIDTLLNRADHVLLKLSPMLDWRKAVADVGAGCVEQVHIVATGGECKELLLLLSPQGSSEPLLVCAHDDSSEAFPLSDSHLQNVYTAFGQPQVGDFLYEPHAALMKGGRYGELAQRYAVAPLAPNSHLFTSKLPATDFPGRSFQVCAVSSMNKRELKAIVMPLRQANITVRNFPLTVAELRSRLKLSEGGSNYVFATTLANRDRVLLVCRRL